MFIFTGGGVFWAFGNFCCEDLRHSLTLGVNRLEIWFGPVLSLLGEFWQLWYPFEFWPFYLCVQGFMPFPGCVSHDFRNLPARMKIILMENKVFFLPQEPQLQPCWFPLTPAEVRENTTLTNSSKPIKTKKQIIFLQLILHQFQKGVILHIDLVGKIFLCWPGNFVYASFLLDFISSQLFHWVSFFLLRILLAVFCQILFGLLYLGREWL